VLLEKVLKEIGREIPLSTVRITEEELEEGKKRTNKKRTNKNCNLSCV